MKNKKVNRSAAVLMSLFMFLAININSQGMDVPANLQVALFSKIFMFNKTVQAKGVEVAVLSSDNSGGDVVSAFTAAGIKAKAVSSVPAGAAIVYVMPGTAAPKAECAKNGIFSISGVGADAESGNVAISIGVEGGKPKIIVNATQLKAENQDISADLLKIAKVVQ